MKEMNEIWDEVIRRIEKVGADAEWRTIAAAVGPKWEDVRHVLTPGWK